MNPGNKTDFVLIAAVLILTGLVLAYTAFDAPPLAAPTVVYDPPASEASAAPDPKPASSAPSSASAARPASSEKQSASSRPPASSADPGPIRINLNTADKDELMRLTTLKIGISERIVDNILEYRATYGPFAHPEDLIAVSGIGEKKLAAVLPYLYATPPEAD